MNNNIDFATQNKKQEYIALLNKALSMAKELERAICSTEKILSSKFRDKAAA